MWRNNDKTHAMLLVYEYVEKKVRQLMENQLDTHIKKKVQM